MISSCCKCYKEGVPEDLIQSKVQGRCDVYLGSELRTGVNQGREKKLFPRWRNQHGSRPHAMKEHSMFEKKASMAARRNVEKEVRPDWSGPRRHVQQGLVSIQNLLSELTLFSASIKLVLCLLCPILHVLLRVFPLMLYSISLLVSHVVL